MYACYLKSVATLYKVMFLKQALTSATETISQSKSLILIVIEKYYAYA